MDRTKNNNVEQGPTRESKKEQWEMMDWCIKNK